MKIPPRNRIRSDSCPNCGSVGQTRTYSDDVEFRSLPLELLNLEEMVCPNCANVWKTEAQRVDYRQALRVAYSENREKTRAKQGLLSGSEIKAIRESLDITQRDASDLLGGGENSFNKYESGEVLQSAAMDLLIRLAYSLGANAISRLQAAKHARPTTAGLFVLSSGMEMTRASAGTTYATSILLVEQKKRPTRHAKAFTMTVRSPAKDSLENKGIGRDQSTTMETIQ